MKRNTILYKIKFAQRLIYATIFFATGAFAQSEKESVRTDQCSVQLKAEDVATYKKAVEEQHNHRFAPLSTIYVPVRLHCVRHSNGTGGVTEAQAEQELASANAKFAPAGIQFFQCRSVEFIDDDAIWNTNYSINETLSCGSTGPAYQLCNAHNASGCCNIYWVNVQGNWNWGSFPWYVSQNCADKLMMNINGIGSQWLLAHELGHYFGLLHTFETANGAENVTRNTGNGCYNALSAGDLLDDTPADPNSWSSCSYTGGFVDGCGAGYSPDAQNEMCYANGCQTYFTADQNSRMLSMYSQYRGYLSCGYVSNCNSTWTLSSTQITDFAYQASNQINSSSVINAGVTSVYDAANRIVLTAGFRTGTNTDFRANIKPCYTPHIFNKNIIEVPQAGITDPVLNLMAMPNPFADVTTLQFTTDETKHLHIYITDLSGRKIKGDIVNETRPSGTYQAEFDGSSLETGIYLCVLEENNKRHVLKLVISH